MLIHHNGWIVGYESPAKMTDIENIKPLEFVYGERTIGYVIRPSRSRSVRIVVSGPEEIEVRVPPRMSVKTVHAFVEKHAEWILQALAKQALRPRLAPLNYAAGEVFFYLGKPHRLTVTRSVWKTVTREEGELRVTNVRRVKELVEAWFHEQAEALLARYLSEALERFGRRISGASCPLMMRSGPSCKGIRLTVRSMRTRWGSCSPDGHITLSVELIHAPHRLIEYVIVHELCHLAHLDHSAAFHFQLARCLPDWEQRRRELETGKWRQAQVQQ